MIKDTSTLKKSAKAETAAVEGILDLFLSKGDVTSKKSPREITALVLMQIKDACIVAPKSEETEESLMIIHVNQYLEKIIGQLQSNKPLKIVISGTSFSDMINNLKTIRGAAKEEQYYEEIKKRLDSFIRKINNRAAQAQAAKRTIITKSIIFGLLTGFCFCYIHYLVHDIELDVDYFFMSLAVSAVAWPLYIKLLSR